MEMFYASDDDAAAVPSSSTALPRPQKRKLDLTFLGNQCRCQYGKCFQQFLGEVEAVREKRTEFSKMENSRKASSAKSVIIF